MEKAPEDFLEALLQWGNTIQAIARTGLGFSNNFHDRERYEQLLEIASRMLSSINSELKVDPLQAEAVQKLLHMEIRSGEAGYITPKSSVAAAVFNSEGQLLLVKPNSRELWCLPGGWAEAYENPAENAQREVLEESNLHVRAKTLLGVFDSRRHPHGSTIPSYTLLFACELLSGELSPLNAEVSSAQFFSREMFPPLISGAIKQVEVAIRWQQGEPNEPFFDR
jgi:ADP-ribose pyrophosphatase YjhB (NUDIX family)